MEFFSPINEFPGANNRITTENLVGRKIGQLAAKRPEFDLA
jgi:hypothetical protein